MLRAPKVTARHTHSPTREACTRTVIIIINRTSHRPASRVVRQQVKNKKAAASERNKPAKRPPDAKPDEPPRRHGRTEREAGRVKEQ